jgi:hypothetical protein
MSQNPGLTRVPGLSTICSRHHPPNHPPTPTLTTIPSVLAVLVVVVVVVVT